MDTVVQNNIIDAFEEKRSRGERWENEYGCLHIQKARKEYYDDSSQYKIQVHTRNNVKYFKVVPRHYRIPCNYQDWYYYDGCVLGNYIEWKRILVI